MQTASTTGRKSRTTDEATLQENPDDGQCVVCTAPADGVDAAREGNPPVCSTCAKIRADGGRAQTMYAVEVYQSGGDDLGEIVVPQVPTTDDKIRTSDGTIYRVVSRTWLLAASISYDAVASITVEPAGVDPDVNRGEGAVADGGVPEHVDDELAKAVASIPDADVESIAQYDDRSGHFVIESEPDDQNVDEIDAALEEAGYERNGHLPVPGMTQQNFRPVEENGGDSA